MLEANDTIESVTVRKVVVPYAIAPKTAAGNLDNFSAVLIDLKTRNGVIGCSYVWSFSELFLTPLAATVQALAATVVDQPLAPLELERSLRQRLRLIDTSGLVGLALAGLDMAAWDAFAVGLDRPLARVLGSDVTQVAAYNSCGLWIQEPAALPDEVKRLTAMHGFNAIKLRLGRSAPDADIAAIESVRNTLASADQLMVDYNQSLSVAEAMRRLPALDQLGLYWIEEPIRHANIEGMAAITQAISTPTQIGENLCDDAAMQRAIMADAARFYMPDLQRIGGISGWLRASALCHANDLSISSHLFPEFSVHALAASPTRHWLEYVDWADALLLNPLQVHNGMAQVPDRAGAGIEWNEDAVGRFQVE